MDNDSKSITTIPNNRPSNGHGGFRGSFTDHIKRQGLTEEFMAGKLMEWMNAKKVVSARVIARKGKHSTEPLPADSETDDFIEVPDYETQIKAFKYWNEAIGTEDKSKLQIKRKLSIEEYVEGPHLSFDEFIADSPEKNK